MTTKVNTENRQMSLSLDLERRVFRVSELNAAVQELLERNFCRIWVAGEISGFRAATSGHLYFYLKDAESQLKCVLFKSAARLARFKPQDGLAVIARGNLEVYEARGEYQFIVEILQPQGAGALQLAFEQLKRRLAAEGLFEASRKRALPRLPRRLGIVTSLSGAVLHDILQILDRRFRALHIRIYPAQVQGEGSVEQVCRALNYFSESGWAEIVILARGGGSLEDLWTFNEEAVARVIAACSVPVVSAIGHETDFTISDFVADHRAPTPSAAAEIVICTQASLLEQVGQFRAKATQYIRYKLLCSARDLNQRGTERATTLLHRAITRRSQALDDLDFRLRNTQRQVFLRHSRSVTELVRRLQASDMRLRIAQNRHGHEILRARMVKSIEQILAKSRNRHQMVRAHAEQLSPLAVLARGYAIVLNTEGHILRSAAGASVGEKVHIRLHHGALDAVVSERRGPI